MNARELKGVIYILISAMVSVFAQGTLAWQAMIFQPEFQVASVNFRHPEVLGLETSTGDELPSTEKQRFCKTEAEAAWHSSMTENSQSIAKQFCLSRAPSFPCEPLPTIEKKYSDQISQWFIADLSTRNQVITDRVKVNRDTQITEVEKLISAQYAEADKRYSEVFINCLEK